MMEEGGEAGLGRYREGEFQGPVLNLASGEFGLFDENKGVGAIWASSLDTCALVVMRSEETVAAVHYRDRGVNGGLIERLGKELIMKGKGNPRVEIVWGRLNQGESLTRQEIRKELAKLELPVEREVVGSNGLYVMVGEGVEAVEQLPEKWAEEVKNYYRGLVRNGS